MSPALIARTNKPQPVGLAGHPQVGDDDVERARREELERIGAARCDGDAMTCSTQTDREELAHRLFVVDNQDLGHGSLCHVACYGSRMRSRLYEIAFVRGALVAIAGLALYVWLCPEFIVSGDNAEFVAIGARGGVPHPSGYPLYVLWLRAMSWLPGATPAHTTAIATALLAGLTLFVLHGACRAWGRVVWRQRRPRDRDL